MSQENIRALHVNEEINAPDEMEIDLLELMYRLIERGKHIIAAALLGAVLMGVYSFLIAKPTYEATSQLYVLSQQNSAINLSDLQIGTQLTNDYIQVFETWEVQEMVLAKLENEYGYTNLEYEYEELRDMLTIKNPSNTRVLQLTVTAYDPQEAADIANVYAEVAQYYISEVMLTDEPSLLSSALVPTEKSGPRRGLNMILGFMLGAIAACAVIVIQFLMDDKIKNGDDIRKYVNLPTLAIVPINSHVSKNGVVQVQTKNAAERKGTKK